MGSSKNKSSSSHHHRSSNGSLQEIFNSCVNCEIPLDNGTTKVAEFMLSFSESNKRTFSVLEALSSIFELSTSEFEKRKLPALTTKNLVMCPQCATVLANLYKSYVELMQLSKSSANICKLINKAQMWHQKKQEFLSNSPDTSEEEDDEENSDSDEEIPPPPSRKKYTPVSKSKASAAASRASIKREPVDDDDDEEEEEDEDDDDDEEYEVAAKRRKSGLTLKKSKGSKRGRKAKKVEHSDNGEYEDDQDYDSDDEDFTPKRKTPGSSARGGSSSAAGDRGRSRQRARDSTGGSILSSDGTPRKRIRRRPSQTREDDYKCTECDRIFKFECRLIKHMKTHQDEKKLYCNKCDKSYIYSWMLENHVLSVHEKVVPDECEVCGLNFFRKDIFDNHFCTPKNKQAEERREKPHWCQLCGKSFNKLAHLTLHLRSHEDEKPLNCPSCSLKFKYEKCLQKHLQVHESEFQCPVCKKAFQQKSRMKAHLATHSSKDKSRSRTSLNAIMASSSPANTKDSQSSKDSKDSGPFHCSSCTLTFFRKTDLNRHTKSKNCKGNMSGTPSSGTLKKSIKIKHESMEMDTEPIDSPEEENYGDSDVSSDEEEANATTTAATPAKKSSNSGAAISGDISDVDSMSPAVSHSDNEEQASLPSSPARSPKLNLSEDESEAGELPEDPADAPETESSTSNPNEAIVKPLGIGKIEHQRMNEPDLSDNSN